MDVHLCRPFQTLSFALFSGSVRTRSAVCAPGEKCVFKELMARLSIRLGSEGGHRAVKTKSSQPGPKAPEAIGSMTGVHCLLLLLYPLKPGSFRLGDKNGHIFSLATVCPQCLPFSMAQVSWAGVYSQCSFWRQACLNRQ